MKFKIVETVTDTRFVEANSAQEALELWLTHGTDHPAVKDESCAGVDERDVYDEDGNWCETQEP